MQTSVETNVENLNETEMVCSREKLNETVKFFTELYVQKQAESVDEPVNVSATEAMNVDADPEVETDLLYSRLYQLLKRNKLQ